MAAHGRRSPRAALALTHPGQARAWRALLLACAALLAVLALMTTTPLAHADTITVTNTNDSGAGSLRQAIKDATSSDTIAFDSGATGTITLTSGQLAIDKDLTIVGPGADELTVSGSDNSRVFEVESGTRVTMENLTIANGDSQDDGGGIYNAGTLTVTSSTFSDNDSAGIYNGNEIVHLHNTILGSCWNDPNRDTQFGFSTNNLFRGSSTCMDRMTNTIDKSPGLEPLADNGGPTKTHALRETSPAIDAGANDWAVDADGNPLATDQRGTDFDRIVNGTVDVGAYEFGNPPILSFDAPSTGGKFSLRLDSGGDTVQIVDDSDAVEGTADAGASVTYNGADAVDDTLVVDFTNGNPIPNGLTYHGGAGGNDAIEVIGGSFDTTTYTLTNASDGIIDYDGTTITFDGLEPITDNASSTHRVFTFNGGTETITLSDATSTPGFSTVDSTEGESVTFTNPTDSLTLNAGDGTDTVEVVGLDSGFAASVTVNGGTGIDSVTVSSSLNTGGGDFTVEAESFTASAPLTAAAISVTADSVALDDTLTGTGSLTLQPTSRSRSIGLGGGAGDFNLDDTELGNLADGFSDITIGRSDGAGISINGTVNGTAGGSTEKLTLKTGTGDATASAAVGNSVPIALEQTGGSGNTTFERSVALAGPSSFAGFAGNLDLNDDLTIHSGASFTAPGTGVGFTIAGNVTHEGAFTANGGKVTFDGGANQNLAARATLTFADVEVATGTLLVETETGSDHASYTGTLTNNGTIEKTRAVTGTGALGFGLTDADLNVDATGTLATVKVERFSTDHAQATTNLKHGQYWTISAENATGGTPSGYQVDLTLLHAIADDSKARVCRYTGTGTQWSCRRDASTASTVTRNDITTLSDWTTGDPDPDIRVEKTDSDDDPIVIGGSLTYTITVTNDGPDSASGVELTDVLPTGFSDASDDVSASITQGSCTYASATRTVTCDIGDTGGSSDTGLMDVGDSVSVTVTVVAETAGTYFNEPTATLNEADSDTTDNTGSVVTTVIAQAAGTGSMTFSSGFWTGSYTIDADADALADDDIHYVLSDTDSNGVYDTMDSSLGDETYGQGGGLANDTVTSGDDERITATDDLDYGSASYKFTTGFSAGPETDSPDARITALTHFEGSFVFDADASFVLDLEDDEERVFFALSDLDSNGLYDAMDLSITPDDAASDGDPDTHSRFGEGDQTDRTIVDGNDERITGITTVLGAATASRSSNTYTSDNDIKLGTTYSVEPAWVENPPNGVISDQAGDAQILHVQTGSEVIVYEATESWQIDADGDETAEDHVFFVLSATGSTAVIDTIDISIGDLVFGEGDLDDGLVDFGAASNTNDERFSRGDSGVTCDDLTCSRVVTLGTHPFLVAFDKVLKDKQTTLADPPFSLSSDDIPAENDDARISARWYTGTLPVDVDNDQRDNTLDFVQIDPNSDGLYTVLELDGDDSDGYDSSEVHRAAGERWFDPVAAGGAEGRHTSIDTTGEDTALIASYDEDDGDLLFTKTTNAGLDWTDPVTIDAAGDVGRFASLKAIDASTLYASYYDATSGDLKFAKSTDGGATWSTVTVDDGSGDDVGRFSSLGVVDGSTLYVSYYNADGKDLKVARSTDEGDTWTPDTVDSGGDVGQYSSIAVLPDSVLHDGSSTDDITVYVAYYDESNGDLKTARSTDAGNTWPGATWTTVTIDDGSGDDVGRHTSIAAVRDTTPNDDADSGDTVFISYYDADNADLKAAKTVTGGDGGIGDPTNEWTAAEGGFVKTVDSAGDVGRYSALTAVEEMTVFIAYYDASNGNLESVRSTDGGDTFEDPVTVDSAGDVGRFASVVHFRTHTVFAAYYDADGEGLRFAKSRLLVDLEGHRMSVRYALDPTEGDSVVLKNGRILRIGQLGRNEWLFMVPEEAVPGPNIEQTQIRVKLKVPDGAPPGFYQGTLVLRQQE